MTDILLLILPYRTVSMPGANHLKETNVDRIAGFSCSFL
jgi:hypothetical protein